MSTRIAVIGGGFAGLWSAVSAARARALFNIPEDELEIVLITPNPFHTIRVRCYETDLAPVRVPLDDVLTPINVRRIEGQATRIDLTSRTLAVAGTSREIPDIGYDRLILAAGSSLARPPIPQAKETFDVDTYEGGQRLAAHLAALARAPGSDGSGTAVVIGGGLVGVEIACELPGRLRAALGADATVRVVLVDHDGIGAGMGEGRSVVCNALQALGVEARPFTTVTAVDAAGVILSTGKHIPAATVVFATGMRASSLTRDLGVACDRLGRVPVNRFLEVTGADAIYAAGDCAAARADDIGHMTVMSCQHARPMGRVAGHNAVCDIAGRPGERIPFTAPDYVTILDLGPFGALYTAGWERGTVVATGAKAKATKQIINGARIYPPRNASREAIFAAGAPVIQARPAVE
ncbi:MAG: pyridine nucleotide-disulfide oxidoreductase [Beijerinckiaceae bacterium]|nr:MAG: pyridine nucleotide-disulfide oxidoreductase [Beijerinckiaceae bacterium]